MRETQLYVITLRILRGSNFYEHCWVCETASDMEGTVYWIFYDCLLIWHFERLWEVKMATAAFQSVTDSLLSKSGNTSQLKVKEPKTL